MSLKANVLTAIDQALIALDDLAVEGTYSTRTATAYVPGQAQTYTGSNYAIKVVVDKYTFKEIMTGQIQGTDVRLLIFPFSVIPQPNDVVSVNGRSYRVIANMPTYVGSEIALNEVQGRPLA